MTTIYTINEPDAEHLETVTEEMKILGSPIIRAFWTGDAYYAIEGSHRCFSAAKLGITILIKTVTEDEVITGHDIEDLPEVTTVSEILEYMNGMQAVDVETDEI